MPSENATRSLHVASIGGAVVLVLVGVLVLTGAANATARLGILALLVVLLALQVVLFWQDRKLAHLAEQQPWEPPAESAAPAAAAPVAAAPEAAIQIRCKQCAQVFPVVDTGARPLVAACPHCGKTGTIKVKPRA